MHSGRLPGDHRDEEGRSPSLLRRGSSAPRGRAVACERALAGATQRARSCEQPLPETARGEHAPMPNISAQHVQALVGPNRRSALRSGAPIDGECGLPRFRDFGKGDPVRCLELGTLRCFIRDFRDLGTPRFRRGRDLGGAEIYGCEPRHLIAAFHAVGVNRGT